jgi:hypothetical protein
VIGPQSTLTDVGFAVCTALSRVGIVAVMTGGSAATFYAPDAYQSRDLDFVITVRGAGAGAAALAALGFTEKGQVYRHAQTHFTLDFPRGPLAVGDELLMSWRTERRDDELLHVLTPTDCCRDRLASFLFWNDFSGLQQALAVAAAQRQALDVGVIAAWCRKEGHLQKFDLFRSRLEA